MRCFTLSLVLFLSAWALAQADSSLTHEFAGLSAKERNRLAMKEQEEARKDIRFNEVMAEAEGYFQAQRYDDALSKYAEARKLRPLNVFPKVKIQDLQALLEKRSVTDVAVSREEPGPLPKFEPQQEVVSEPVEPPASLPIVAPPAVVERQQPAVEPRRERPAVASPPPTPLITDEHQALPAPDGVQERSFMEGRAVVLERVVVKDGLTVVFRKVTHPWGQVVHFRDGQAISEREWLEALPGR